MTQTRTKAKQSRNLADRLRRALLLIDRRAATTNRLIGALIVAVTKISHRPTHGELLSLLETTGLSRTDIASALGTTIESLNVAHQRRKQEKPYGQKPVADETSEADLR